VGEGTVAGGAGTGVRAGYVVVLVVFRTAYSAGAAAAAAAAGSCPVAAASDANGAHRQQGRVRAVRRVGHCVRLGVQPAARLREGGAVKLTREVQGERGNPGSGHAGDARRLHADHVRLRPHPVPAHESEPHPRVEPGGPGPSGSRSQIWRRRWC